jgi:hypothetical protein
MPHKDKVVARTYKREWCRVRLLLIAQLKNKPCLDCGNRFHFSAMDFDHRENNKFKGVSSMLSYSLKRIHEEIAKCDLVCSNCHRVRTFKRMEDKLVRNGAYLLSSA